MPQRRRLNRPPLVRCEPSTAVFLGARRLEDARMPREAVIAIRTSDGRCWLWPVESELYAAILRA